MISAISGFKFDSINKFNYVKNNQVNTPTQSFVNSPRILSKDTVSFTGMSAPSQYKSVFEYLAADILGKNKKFQVDGSMLSANNIEKALDKLFTLNKVYGPYTESNSAKIKWKTYIPQDIRDFSIDKINEARASRLQQWQRFLEAPQANGIGKNHTKLADSVRNNKALKFVIWNAVNSELKNKNRHIPVPFEPEALYRTIIGFEKIEPLDRAVRCASPSFIEIYTHRLRDLLLENKGLSENKSVWVRIPSIKNDPLHKETNIATLETLSNKNWCTRSSVDKAEAALEDGDFFVYLERDKNNLWKTKIGMTSSQGKIDQIQGPDNNNIVPLNEVENIKNYIKSQGLKCNSGVIAEGPKAMQQILISEHLNKFDEGLGKTLEKAIKDEDDFGMFKFLTSKVKKLDNGKLEISSYKPNYSLDLKSGLSVPYSMLGVNEDVLLKNVEKIDGNWVLDNKNQLFNSSITTFPPSLKTVNGRIVCSQKQFDKFGADFQRVLGNNGKIIVHE